MKSSLQKLFFKIIFIHMTFIINMCFIRQLFKIIILVTCQQNMYSDKSLV